MKPKLDYPLVTQHRWLWPWVELGAVLLYTARDIALKREARRAARNRRAATRW